MSRSLRARRTTLSASAVAVILAGCGNAQHATRAQFVAQADPICKQAAAERAAANAAIPNTGAGPRKDMPILARVAPSVAADEHQAVNRLRALRAPASLAHDWRNLLAGIQELANDTTRLAAAAKADNFRAVQAIDASGRQLDSRLSLIAARDGFAFCGRTS